jgi:hypothetical protein
VIRASLSIPHVFNISSTELTRKDTDSQLNSPQFMLGNPSSHIRHHIRASQRAFRTIGKSSVWLAAASARPLLAPGWLRRNISFFRTTLRISGPLELARSEREDFVDVQQRFFSFSDLSLDLGAWGCHVIAF